MKEEEKIVALLCRWARSSSWTDLADSSRLLKDKKKTCWENIFLSFRINFSDLTKVFFSFEFRFGWNIFLSFSFVRWETKIIKWKQRLISARFFFALIGFSKWEKQRKKNVKTKILVERKKKIFLRFSSEKQKNSSKPFKLLGVLSKLTRRNSC